MLEWEIDDFWGFEWVFLDLNIHLVPTRCVGVFEIAWEICVFFSKSTYIFLLIVFFHTYVRVTRFIK